MPDKSRPSKSSPTRSKPLPESGYPHEQPKPATGGAKVPGTGKPHESQNMPKQKPGKGSA